MGQRLVVTIKADNKEQMKIYYHWSGYTNSTFYKLSELWYKCIRPLKDEGRSTKEILYGIIRFLENNVDEEYLKVLKENFPEFANRSCHGGVASGEMKYISDVFTGEKFLTNVDRNEGLVYMSAKGMNDAQSWSEGDAEIDLDTETFVHYIYDRYDNKNEFSADYGDELYDKLPTYDGHMEDLFSGKCDEIEQKGEIVGALTKEYGKFIDSMGAVCEDMG